MSSLVLNSPMRAEDRILKQRITVMKDTRFIALSGIFMVGKWKIIEAGVTAVTNGRDVIYGRKFVDGLDDPTLRFVILHEYYHILLMHMIVWKHLWGQWTAVMPDGTEVDLANIAADFVINIILDKAAGKGADNFITVWPHACLDYQYDGMDTGEVFRKLIQQMSKNPPPPGRGKGGQGQRGTIRVKAADGGDASSMDEHEPGTDAEDGDGGEDGAFGGKLTEEEVKELRGQIDEALRQGKQIAGKVGGKFDRSLDGLLETTVPWQDVLQDFVKTHAAGNDLSTWRKPSRRWMAMDVMMPSHYAEAAKRITIGVDTSGSIGESQLKKALGEIKGACDVVHPEMVDLIYWDYEVAGHEVYENDAIDHITEFTKPKGGGGTRVGSMLAYMKAKDIKPDCVIIFSDGFVESDFGGCAWPAPVLWCISSKGVVAPHGKTLYVPVE